MLVMLVMQPPRLCYDKGRPATTQHSSPCPAGFKEGRQKYFTCKLKFKSRVLFVLLICTDINTAEEQRRVESEITIGQCVRSLLETSSASWRINR